MSWSGMLNGYRKGYRPKCLEDGSCKAFMTCGRETATLLDVWKELHSKKQRFCPAASFGGGPAKTDCEFLKCTLNDERKQFRHGGSGSQCIYENEQCTPKDLMQSVLNMSRSRGAPDCMKLGICE